MFKWEKVESNHLVEINIFTEREVVYLFLFFYYFYNTVFPCAVPIKKVIKYLPHYVLTVVK